MESVQDRVAKLRQERIAREKARLEKLREMNLKKYNSTESFANPWKNIPVNEMKKTKSIPRIKDDSAPVKNNFHVNGTTKRPITAPALKTVKKTSPIKDVKRSEPAKAKNEGTTAKNCVKVSHRTSTIPNIGDSNKIVHKPGTIPAKTEKIPSKPSVPSKSLPVPNSNIPGSSNTRILKEIKPKSDAKIDLSKFALKNSMRKSLIPFSKPAEKPTLSRKSMFTKMDSKDSKESVFERLYKPKYEPKPTQTKVEKIQKDPAYLKQVIKSSGLILSGNLSKQPVRRSISAVHFKRINKSELPNCIHKCSSVGDKLNKAHLENDILNEEQVTSAIKNERKKVKFMTPISFNTPRPEELQYRLKNWLQKRGKSLDSYHHLQCFGLHYMSTKHDDHLQRNFDFDDENKENVALESDSDDGSYNENMSLEKEKVIVNDLNDFNKWRRVSSVSESIDFDDSHRLDETLTSEETNDDLVKGALIDLAELTREGFDWKQSARWLRAIKERYPAVTACSAYWECKAVLEEFRGAPFASLHCWEEAVAKGTEQKVAEANLDHLLDKFIQLKINPNAGQERRPDPKQLVDMNNIFRSSVIRFTITQAKQRQTQTPLACVTPVRRSGRLSVCPNSQQKVCENMRQVAKLAPVHKFTPNKNLVASP